MAAPNPPRDIPGVIAPPPFIFAGFLLAGWGLDRVLNLPGLQLEQTPRAIAALTPIIIGLVIEMWAGGLFKKAGTNVAPWQPSTALVTEGPYRFSRNPMYLGFALTYLGIAIGLNSPIAIVLLPLCLLVLTWGVIRREEAYMERRFGQAYVDYRQRVRRWL